jgi:hypothetical protein
MTLGYLFGLGNLLLGETQAGIIWLAVAVGCTVGTVWAIRKMTADAPDSIGKPMES